MQFQKSDFYLKKNSFFVCKKTVFFFCQKCSLSIKKHKNETASHSDHPLKGHDGFCVSYFGPFYCLMQFALESASLC